jgi:hypothetical protein
MEPVYGDDYSCVVSSDTRQILLEDFVDQTYSASSKFVFVISGLEVRNPDNVQESSPVALTTYQDGYAVDTSSTVTITPTASTIKSVKIEASSYETNKEDVTYFFKITLGGYVLKDAVLRIDFPNQISVYKKTELQNCGLE